MAGIATEDSIPHQASFRVSEVMKMFNCPLSDILDLITQGEICIATERIVRPPSVNSFVPRDSLIAFVRRQQQLVDDLIPPNQESFPLHQLAKIFACSVNHLFNLITEGEIVVPEEVVSRAPSRGMIVVSRENLVVFLRRRSSAEWFSRAPKPRRKRKGGHQ